MPTNKSIFYPSHLPDEIEIPGLSKARKDSSTGDDNTEARLAALEKASLAERKPKPKLSKKKKANKSSRKKQREVSAAEEESGSEDSDTDYDSSTEYEEDSEDEDDS